MTENSYWRYSHGVFVVPETWRSIGFTGDAATDTVHQLPGTPRGDRPLSRPSVANGEGEWPSETARPGPPLPTSGEDF